MPLKDLVEDDAVHESPQADAQQYARGGSAFVTEWH